MIVKIKTTIVKRALVRDGGHHKNTISFPCHYKLFLPSIATSLTSSLDVFLMYIFTNSSQHCCCTALIYSFVFLSHFSGILLSCPYHLLYSFCHSTTYSICLLHHTKTLISHSGTFFCFQLCPVLSSLILCLEISSPQPIFYTIPSHSLSTTHCHYVNVGSIKKFLSSFSTS